RALAEELTGAVVQMYGMGLERIVELLDDDARGRLAEDDVVAGLLMIHDLYPVPLEERVAQALDRVRPYMESHGGDVELLGIEDGVARLRLEGSCSSCQASSATPEPAGRAGLWCQGGGGEAGAGTGPPGSRCRWPARRRRTETRRRSARWSRCRWPE